jgi:hypothetical protein
MHQPVLDAWAQYSGAPFMKFQFYGAIGSSGSWGARTNRLNTNPFATNLEFQTQALTKWWDDPRTPTPSSPAALSGIRKIG